MKLLAFYLRHKVRTSRTIAPAAVTLENIRSIRELRDFEATYKPSDDVPSINAKDWPKTMESILEYLRSYLGDKKIPLAYVVRKDENVPDEDPDGGYVTVATRRDDRSCTTLYDGRCRTHSRPNIPREPREGMGYHSPYHS
ncbi:hypothetical protein MHU86_25078 [Fragilaria crotonensis]|nr:hypothetical protein MHU86_25078 [Fragilaria crotonensis]